MANSNWAAGQLPAAEPIEDLAWLVFRASFPFSVGCELGLVRAPTKALALSAAIAQFGPEIVVGRASAAAARRSAP
jgi:hypothetical protein